MKTNMMAFASGALIFLTAAAIPKQVKADDWWDNAIGGLAAGAFISNYFSPRPNYANAHGPSDRKYRQINNGSRRYHYGDAPSHEQKHPYGAPYKHWTEF